MNTYTLRAQVQQAIQWSGDNLQEILNEFADKAYWDNDKLVIATLDDPMPVKLGWYIARDLDTGVVSLFSEGVFKSLMVA